jgi:hypothetical protein
MPRRIVMRIIEIDKTIQAHPEVIFEKRNPENHHIMKYVIVLIAPHQYFRQAIHYQSVKDNEEDESTQNLNHHHLLSTLAVQRVQNLLWK